MDKITVILLTALVVGFLYRGMKLMGLIKNAFYYSTLKEGVTPDQAQFQGASAGCLGMMCFPFFCFFFITPVFLFFRVDWWIPIIAYIIGLSICNLLGYVVERILHLPNHQNFAGSSFDLNAVELTCDNGMYIRVLGLLFFYNVSSLIISLIIIFCV